MADENFAAFEARAAEAEARLAALESGGGGAGSVELLQALRGVRAELGAARWSQQALEARAAAAEAQAAALRSENEKLRYRVTHLVRNLREARCGCVGAPFRHSRVRLPRRMLLARRHPSRRWRALRPRRSPMSTPQRWRRVEEGEQRRKLNKRCAGAGAAGTRVRTESPDLSTDRLRIDRSSIDHRGDE